MSNNEYILIAYRLDDLRPLGGLVKKYGYYGAFLAIQQSIEQRDLGSVGKYYYWLVFNVVGEVYVR